MRCRQRSDAPEPRPPQRCAADKNGEFLPAGPAPAPDTPEPLRSHQTGTGDRPWWRANLLSTRSAPASGPGPPACPVPPETPARKRPTFPVNRSSPRAASAAWRPGYSHSRRNVQARQAPASAPGPAGWERSAQSPPIRWDRSGGSEGSARQTSHPAGWLDRPGRLPHAPVGR